MYLCNMVLKSEIEKAFQFQQSLLKLKTPLTLRTDLEKIPLYESHIVVVSGIRRCGKSTLLRLVMQKTKEKFAFLNFEDSRIFNFELEDFSKLDEIIGDDVQFYFFDEIQNVPNWEIFVRQLHDRGKKIFITGSNASLLSKELGTRLTGRYLTQELFPFSYGEFLSYENLENNFDSFDKYIEWGGFPEFLESGNQEILQTLVKDIVYRDISIRYGIKNSKTLMDITLFLLSSVGKEVTYNSIKKMFSVGSANSVSDYLNWLEDCYLVFFLSKFSWSPKTIAVNPRKVYAIDSALAQANSLSFTKDKGRLFENTIYIFLRRQNLQLYYFRENGECDFVIFEKKKCKMVIQVCEELHLDNKHREINGLLEAMNFFDLKEGFIVTKNQSDTLKIEGKTIHLIPAIDWMKTYFGNNL